MTFLDVLGFREVVSKRTADEVATTLDLVRRSSGATEKDQGRGYEPHVLIFSDAIIRVRPIDSTHNARLPIGLPFHELVDLLHIQAGLVTKGILVRGAVTLGDALVEGSQVFGPGIVAAYDLESQFARYPRIIVSPHLLRATGLDPRLKADHHTATQEMEYVHNLLRRGDDGIWFLDYLRTYESELDDPSDYLDFLTAHRDLIRSGANAAREITNAAVKYTWLSHYHNAIVDVLRVKALREYGVTRKQFRIGPHDVPIFYELPASLHLTSRSPVGTPVRVQEAPREALHGPVSRPISPQSGRPKGNTS